MRVGMFAHHLVDAASSIAWAGRPDQARGRRRELAAIEGPAERLAGLQGAMVGELYERGEALNAGCLSGRRGDRSDGDTAVDRCLHWCYSWLLSACFTKIIVGEGI